MKDQCANICREIVNTKSVIQNKLTESLIEHLVATGKASKDDCKDVNSFLSRDVELQMNSLVDRVLKSFNDKK